MNNTNKEGIRIFHNNEPSFRDSSEFKVAVVSTYSQTGRETLVVVTQVFKY